MKQMELLEQFDGATYNEARDGARLRSQLERVKAALSDGQWWTLAQLARASGGSEASVSARLRDLRKDRFGAHVIERQHVECGLWSYRMVA
jgi:hypothetical protein